MKKSCAAVILLIVLCVIINDVKSRATVRKIKPEDKIVGGHNITIEDAPYVAFLAMIVDGGVSICGGSIISETYILTAAHCLIDVESVKILVGTADLDEGGTDYESTIFYSHPLYNDVTYEYDVAVIKVEEGIMLNGNTTKVITLVDEGTDLETGSIILVTGWGVTYEDSVKASEFLMGVEVPIISQDECKQSIEFLTPRQFCAGESEGGKDSCRGDSGGPAVYKNSGVQVGIVSFGYGCARPDYPGVYVAVASVRGWIKEITGV